jgi:hypothetical protein
MLSQVDADRFIIMDKTLSEGSGFVLPSPGQFLELKATSLDNREQFIFSIQRGRLRLEKYSQQERYTDTSVLARLCVNYKEHTNPPVFIPPDPSLNQYVGKNMGGTHLHVYFEGVGDRFAIPVPPGDFRDLSNLTITTVDFLKYCHVINIGTVQSGLI